MNVDGRTKVCGLIACPVEHSMSPALQNLLAEKTGLNLIYVPFRVLSEQVETAVAGAYALNLHGLNVTVPHKQRVMQYLSEVDVDAQAIGAVNTLVRTKDGYKGYNTDANGLLRAMNAQGISIDGKSCLLLGAGGAAKAAAYLLAREGAREVFILNRSLDKAKYLADDINTLFSRPLMKAMLLSDWRQLPEQSYLALQTTSVGMSPDSDAAPIMESSFYQLLHTAVDIVYTPLTTRFMKLAAKSGAKTMNGLDMLIYQGVTAFELWNPGIFIEEELVEQARTRVYEHLRGKAG